MASSIVVPTETVMTDKPVKDAFTAASTDISALQTGAGVTSQFVAAGSTKTLVAADNRKTVNLDTAAGSTVTLPAATGTGNRWRFIVTVVATSNNHIVKVANGTDTMQGILLEASDDAANVAKAWPATAGTSDTITLNRTTTGSTIKGEWFEVEDIAAGIFQVFGCLAATGTEATPFSATV